MGAHPDYNGPPRRRTQRVEHTRSPETPFVPSPIEAVASSDVQWTESTLAALIETTKPGITRLVTITSGVGFALAAVSHNWAAWDLLLTALGCLIGTACSAAGANALNQWMERDRDARMTRTGSRPLPRGQLAPGEVFAWGASLAMVGLVVLLVSGGPVPAIISAVTIFSYLLIYTPSKPRTSVSTIIGAVPGALPPLIGWAAASKVVGIDALADPAGWSLFLIMFVWQIPHFLSIAWMYRDDYAAGGHCVLPVVDLTGRSTFAAMLVWTICLIPVSLAPAVFLSDWLGGVYAAVALLLGLIFLGFIVRFIIVRTREAARAAFIWSVIHLPILLLVMVAEAMGRKFFA